MSAPLPGPLAKLGPWSYVIAIAVGLLFLPMIAWFAFPSVKHDFKTASAASASAHAGTDDDGAELPERETETRTPGRRTISGVVLDDAGAPVSGAKVTLSLAGAPIGSTITKRDGKFSIRAVPGELIATATMAGLGTASQSVSEGTITDVELVLKKIDANGISGSVVDADGKGIKDSYVVCQNDPALSAVADENGSFMIAAEADGCSATASHPDFGTTPAVTLQKGAKNRLELPSPGKISGTVVDDRGKPVSSFTIGVESFVAAGGEKDAPFFRQKRFDSPAGEFTLENLAPGQYVLSANAAGMPPAKSRTIEVDSGQRTRGVQITVSAGTTLSGVVFDRDTKAPIEGVRVRLDAAIVGGSGSVATTDARGRYTLTGVPTGSFSARYSHDDYKDRIMSLEASSTDPIKQDVDLAKGGDGDMEMTGIGATLRQGGKFVEVASVLPGGPAEGAGMKDGDRIERIDGKSAQSFSVNDCVQRLRGPEGTRVTVTLGRGTSTLDLSITRAKIER